MEEVSTAEDWDLGAGTMWTNFSLIATALQRMPSDALLLSPMLDSRDPIFWGALLIAAGL